MRLTHADAQAIPALLQGQGPRNDVVHLELILCRQKRSFDLDVFVQIYSGPPPWQWARREPVLRETAYRCPGVVAGPS